MNQNGWRDATTQTRGRWWVIYRLIPFATLIAAACLFGYLVLQPFYHPHVYLLFASAAYPNSLLPEHCSPEEDLAAIQVAQATLLDSSIKGPAGAKGTSVDSGLASPAALDAKLDRLEHREIQGRDVLIVWIGAQMVASPGQIDLLCDNFDPSDAHSGRYPLSKFLERVRECPAQTKLIVVESGWTAHLPRLGIFADCPTQPIRKLVEATKDPSVWVMLSHSDFETSNALAQPHRSALAQFFGDALHGAADHNSDRLLDLAEIFHYTQDHLSDWVQSESGGRSSQTAVLLWGGGQPPAGAVFPVVVPVLPKMPTETQLSGGTGSTAGTAGDANPASFAPHLPKPPSRLAVAISDAAKAPAPADVASTSGTATSGSATKSSDPILTANAAELRTMAWALHDRVVASQETHAIDDAPQFWKALQDRLVTQELISGSTNAVQNAAATSDLRRMVRQLGDLADGRMPQRYQQHDLLPALAQWTEPIELSSPIASLAMSEQLARRGAKPLSADAIAAALRPDATTAALRLDALIEKPDNTEFKKWIAELPARWNEYAEFRLARRLADQPDLNWERARLALKARRMSEKVSAETLDAGAWTREQIEGADRLRLAGERGILAGVRAGDASQAVLLLERSVSEYEQAAAWNSDVLGLSHLTNEALFCLPDYLQWAMLSLAEAEAVAPDGLLLAELIAKTRQAAQLLDRPSRGSLPDVRRLRHELGIVLDKLRKRTLGSTNFASTAARPSAAEMRLRLLALPDLSNPPNAGSAKSPEAATRRDPIARLRQTVEIYGTGLLLFLGDLPKSDKKAAAVAAAIAHLNDKSLTADELRTACIEFGDIVRVLQQSLPGTLQQIASENQDLSDPTKRDRQLQSLRAARRLLYLVHPWDVESLEFTGPAQIVRRAELYDALAWQQRRTAAEIADAPSAELSYLVDAANGFRRASAAIALQPPMLEVWRPGIEIEAPGQLDMANQRDHEFPVSVTNRHDREVDVWLVADYDARVVDIHARDKETLYDETSVDRLPAGGRTVLSATSSADSYPTRLNLATLGPTFKLQPGETKGLWVQLHRKTLAGGDVRVAFRAISPSDYVRRDLMAALPHRLAVDLVAEGIAESWQSQDAALTLYPFPNRTTPYTLSLVNNSAEDRAVSFEIVRVEVPSAIAPPLGDVTAEVADAYLARLGPLVRVLRVETMKVPAGGRRVPIPFTVPAVAEPPTRPHPSPLPKGEATHRTSPFMLAAYQVPAPAEPPGEKLDTPTAKPGPPSLKDTVPLGSVLVAIITDRATNRRVIKRIEIFTQRPARYVHPRVEYDAERRRVDIVVQPIKESALPPEGVWVEGQPDEMEAVESQHRQGAWLRAPTTETTVHVEVPRDAAPIFPIYVNVDGFDRAFRYEVPSGATSRTPVAESSRVSARVLAPKPGALFGPKTFEVPVSLQVDAPHGLLLDGTSFVEIGIDTNRDRELRHKETVRLTSDRQVDLFLDSIAPDGSFAVRSKVAELHVALPAPRLKSMRANILARVSLPTGDAWSDPIEVIFDDELPRVSRLQLTPGASVPQGDELEVSVVASDNELSGVASVEAAIDLQRKGEFGEPPALPGAIQSDGRWSVKLPTKPFRPGLYNILVRATDRVGNKSEYLKSPIEIVVPETEATKKPKLGRIVGKVVYGRFDKKPVSGAPVQLIGGKGDQKLREVTTDDEGGFTIKDVPPGDYKLASEKLITGNRRVVQLDVKVPPPPAIGEPVELLLTAPR